MAARTELRITASPFSVETHEIIIAQLAELGFDSFMESERELLAYSSIHGASAAIEALHSIAIPAGVSIRFSAGEADDRDWNEEWESDFEPVTVDGRCHIRASHHPVNLAAEYNITINPRMAFGTGHNPTTYMMLEALMDMDVDGCRVLDMGCGTGVLAIMSELRKARSVTAIDNDEWAYCNTLENIKINGCSRIEVLLGDAQLLANREFDVVLANINLNVLLANLPAYVQSLAREGQMLLSGILATDVDTLLQSAKSLGLDPVTTRTREGWAMVQLHRP
jgi:ribosomal protein L11 methyltransferase